MSDAISGDEDRKIREYMRMRGSGRRNSVSAEAVQAKEGAVRHPKPAGTADAKLGAKSAGDIAELRKAVAGNILFADLDEEQMNMIVVSCECKQYRDGDTVIRQGEAAHLFYIVKSGSLSVAIRDHDKLVHERRVLTYGPGDCFGELALMYNQERAASVRAKEPTWLWALDRFTFQHVVRDYNIERKKKFYDILSSIPLFKPLKEDEINRLVDLMEAYTYEEGKIIIKQGDPGEALFIVVEGQAMATRQSNLDETKFEPIRYGPRDFFGEVALLSDKPRAATVTATSKIVVSTLDKATFLRLLGPCEEVLMRRLDVIQSLNTTGTTDLGDDCPVSAARIRLGSTESSPSS